MHMILSVRSMRNALASVILLTTALSAQGAPQPYGKHFVSISDVPVQKPSEAVETAFQPRDIEAIEAKVRSAEETAGPYALELTEPLVDSARIEAQQGNYAKALTAYHRALYLIRINSGLYSQDQTAIVRQMMAIHRVTGDLESLDDDFDYLFRINGSGGPPFTAERLDIVLEYLQWKREALHLLNRPKKQLMIDLYTVNRNLVDAAMNSPIAPFHWRQAMILSQLTNLYHLKTYYKITVLEDSYDKRKTTFGENPVRTNMQNQRIDQLLESALGRGSQMLQQLAEESLEHGAVEAARLKLIRADWLLWNDERDRARKLYAEVVSDLQSSGESELLSQWLEQPQELPWYPEFLSDAAVDRAKTEQTVQALFDVNRRGWPYNIEVTARGDSNLEELEQFRKNLARTKFRPRLVTGEPEAVESISRDYQLINEISRQ